MIENSQFNTEFWLQQVVVAAKQRGASNIIGIDLNPEKFELEVQRFGVTHFVNPSDCKEKSVNEVIKEMTNGGADYCFECIGLASLMADAFNSCRDKLNLDDFISHEVSFEDINKDFDYLLEGKSLQNKRCSLKVSRGKNNTRTPKVPIPNEEPSRSTS
ncbi:hypothetical protein Fmac_007881 [Flemingia macrophylla]|uniref:Alcohol dehydrogenase-like C-terminal domain-containing protein n=1 Tax=Flemingia macrophylla TaxID=520843 RepID=A0ABD1MVT2_9FABA